MANLNLKIDMIGLVATDMAATIAFYNLLGLELAHPYAPDMGPYVECSLAGGIRLSVNDLAMVKATGEWVEPVGQRISLAFMAESPTAVDAAYSEITGAGYKGLKEPWDAFWGQRYAQVEDPDGNTVDLFAPLPEA